MYWSRMSVINLYAKQCRWYAVPYASMWLRIYCDTKEAFLQTVQVIMKRQASECGKCRRNELQNVENAEEMRFRMWKMPKKCLFVTDSSGLWKINIFYKLVNFGVLQRLKDFNKCLLSLTCWVTCAMSLDSMRPGR